ncbi:MAG: hypothetical protein ACTS2F_02870 [Thainema sp.]
MTPAQAKPASDQYLASIPEGASPSTTTLPGATRATHEEDLNPSTDLRSLPTGSGSPSSRRHPGATRGGHATTTASQLCVNDLAEGAIAPEFTSLDMMSSASAGPILSTLPTVATPSVLNSLSAIAASTWQLHPTYQLSQSLAPCE